MSTSVVYFASVCLSATLHHSNDIIPCNHSHLLTHPQSLTHPQFTLCVKLCKHFAIYSLCSLDLIYLATPLPTYNRQSTRSPVGLGHKLLELSCNRNSFSHAFFWTTQDIVNLFTFLCSCRRAWMSSNKPSYRRCLTEMPCARKRQREGRPYSMTWPGMWLPWWVTFCDITHSAS